MKTTSHLRIFVVVATITAIACTEPDVFTKQPPTGTNYVPLKEFHTSVTTWQKGENGNYNGIISQTPVTDLTKVQLFWLRNGQRLEINGYHDDVYISATVRQNIFLVNYIAKTPNSAPPFPFEVIIVY